MVSHSTAALGFGRMGPQRELKFALEKYWRSDITSDELLAVARTIEEAAWDLQTEAGIEHITVGDYCLYDNIATWADMLGIVPTRFSSLEQGIDRMFATCRGIDGAEALSSKYQSRMVCHPLLAVSILFNCQHIGRFRCLIR
jgi:5-methyltetrahydropteroyltriglutamate--homocysteine methyltransferase